MQLLQAISEITGQLKIKISYTDISKALNVSRQYIAQIKDKNLSKEQINILENYFNVNLSDKRNKPKFIEIPIMGEIPSCAYGVIYYDNKSKAVYPLSIKLLEDLGVNIETVKMIFAKGDSMYPAIENGDLLLVDLSKQKLYDGKIYCIKISDKIFIKRLQLISENKIKIISDNKDKYDFIYHDFSLNNNNIKILGEILWWCRIYV